MLSGPTRRLTFSTVFLVALLLAPAAFAKPPAANRDSAETTGGQEISDLGLEPTGRFATVVVHYDNTKALSSPGGLPLPGSTATNTHKDIFVCDFGPADQPRAGSGCRGVNHGATYGGTNVAQSVDVTSYLSSTTLTPAYAVGGPGETFSYWLHSSDKVQFTRTLSGPVNNVSVSPDGSRVVAAVSPASVSAPGKIVVYATNGDLKWELELTDSQGNAARPTSLAFSRDGKLLVVGTTKGLLFVDPFSTKPSSARVLSPLDTTSPVTKVVVARAGNALVAGTTDGIFYVPLSGLRPTTGGTWNRGVSDGVTDVALSLDGERFAAASGNRILFYRHIQGPLVAEQLPDVHDAGARVADLAYDETGSLLVAVAGENVIGFGPAKIAPIWTFKATDPARGGLDGPLRKVAVSDGGERIVVAGRTKFMAYTNSIAVTASFGASAPVPIVPARPEAVGFTVTNAGSIPDNYTFVVRAPVGWSATSPSNLALDPDQSAPVNLTLEAPAGTAPGVYPLEVEVRSRAADNAHLRTASLNLSIPRAISLTLETDEEKVLLRQGAEETVALTVRNLGNAEGVVNLTVSQALSEGASWTVRFDKDQVRFPAGGSAQVDLVLNAPSEAGSAARNTLTIRAREGDAEAVRVVTAYVNAQFGADVAVANDTLELSPGESRALGVTIRNTGNTEDTFNVTYTITPAIAAGDWKVTLAEDLKVTLAKSGARTLSVVIRPAVAEPRDASLTIRAVSQGSPANVEGSDVVVLTSRPADPTPDEPGDTLLPAPSPLVLLAVLGAAALLLRRGGLR